MSEPAHAVGGPYYDDLSIGDRFESAPSLTLTEGLAATHQATVGDRLRLSLDHDLSRCVTGEGMPIAHPALVWDVSIGQSTLVTQRVIANLFYRGLVFRRFPRIGDTLRTTTEITGLRTTAAKSGRPARGLAVLHVVTTDQQDRPILDFHRCAMLPVRRETSTGLDAELGPQAVELDWATLIAAAETWDLRAYRNALPGPHFADLRADTSHRFESGDVVSNAPELARLTLNIAAVHHDRTAASSGERLVYGGHTIGIAAAQITRALPSLVTILGWHSCDHVAPVFEGDTLHSEIQIERRDPLLKGSGLIHMRSQVRATRSNGETAAVLDWRLVGLFA